MKKSDDPQEFSVQWSSEARLASCERPSLL